jgi:HAD superfamily hydrolase (TIGR01549 family)
MSISLKPSVIAFDVFGTLVHITQKRAPYKQLIDWMKEQSRLPQPDDAAVIMSYSDDFEELAERFGLTLPEKLLTKLYHDLEAELHSIQLYDDTLSTLEQLKQAGFKIAVCSNLATPYGKAVFPMLPLLDAYAWSYEVGAIKPDPQTYQYLIDQLQCRADEVLFVGDTPLADKKGPIAFGMSARLINRKDGQTLKDVLQSLCYRGDI